jgi:ferredoxin
VTHRFLSHASLTALVAELVAAKTRVIAPVRAQDDPEQVDYRPIHKLEDAALGVRLTRGSLKEFFLPPTEVLLHYKQTKEGVEIREVPTEAPPQVILGSTPCDAAALEVVDKVMGWDYRDELWFGRRAASTIVSLLCTAMDSTCFCTATGLGPDSFRGSDALLVPVEGGYLANVITPKGEALLQKYAEADESMKASAEAAQGEARQKEEKNLAAIPPEFSAWLATNFDNPIWKTIALRCHGCGACAAVCPTCHCFDIVDEHDTADEGVRRRNWDSCQTSKFTLHASGHNPRQSQSERFRQRIQHKFSIYPSRFAEILCTGCGRCTRACPGGMDLPKLLDELMTLAKSEAKSSEPKGSSL